ncbi:hypothetical protein SPRG_18474 [Saprolegnia parasitica CBS 223.65]|uniref:Uncharacterized protein n=1 Tax=Saprolegnia parasitica (strain CBS 223.65) TaxID=695850 RepID=A0A067BNR4_SAPPC|nr:hypothetical protein SPRG_18474 [Saprolegnia parasitica CBS 223.65]KDO15986.1 hypothetical protein SPRG_18474 [Saprolegnia parasitica CBS 223.65]|eukprot:XP_012213305.1 hypothetical protein SPRG_18474 [Saprolegnia parasitica CBS 223.65]
MTPTPRGFATTTFSTMQSPRPVVALARKSFPWMSATGRPTPLPWSPDDDGEYDDDDGEEEKSKTSPVVASGPVTPTRGAGS